MCFCEDCCQDWRPFWSFLAENRVVTVRFGSGRMGNFRRTCKACESFNLSDSIYGHLPKNDLSIIYSNPESSYRQRTQFLSRTIDNKLKFLRV